MTDVALKLIMEALYHGIPYLSLSHFSALDDGQHSCNKACKNERISGVLFVKHFQTKLCLT